MQANTERDNSVKVAVRIRPLNDEELSQDSGLFISTAGLNQVFWLLEYNFNIILIISVSPADKCRS